MSHNHVLQTSIYDALLTASLTAQIAYYYGCLCASIRISAMHVHSPDHAYYFQQMQHAVLDFVKVTQGLHAMLTSVNA